MAIFSRKSSTNKPTQNQAITNGASFEPGVTSGVSAEMPYLEFSQLATGQISQHKQLSSFTRSKNSAKSASKPSRLRKLIGLPAYYWVLIAQLFVILPHSEIISKKKVANLTLGPQTLVKSTTLVNFRILFYTLYVSGGIRTPDRSLRRRMLYPTELLRHELFFTSNIYYCTKYHIKCQ